MLGMYNYMQIGVRGFTMSMPDLDDSQRMEDRWERLIEGGGEDRWPTVNNEKPEDYVFDLNYGFSPLIRVNWVDYRGGALSLTSTEPDVPVLRKYVTQSSCLFLCISGEHLKDGLTARKVHESRITKMQELVQQASEAMHATRENPLPLAIVITKNDLCERAGRRKEAIMADLNTYLSAAFAKDAPVMTTVIPVTLGIALADDRDNGEIEVLGMHIPFIFAAWAAMQKLQRENDYDLRRTHGALDEAQRRWSFGQKAAVADHQSHIKELETKAVTIQTNLARLTEELKGTPIYKGGGQVDI